MSGKAYLEREATRQQARRDNRTDEERDAENERRRQNRQQKNEEMPMGEEEHKQQKLEWKNKKRRQRTKTVGNISPTMFVDTLTTSDHGSPVMALKAKKATPKMAKDTPKKDGTAKDAPKKAVPKDSPRKDGSKTATLKKAIPKTAKDSPKKDSPKKDSPKKARDAPKSLTKKKPNTTATTPGKKTVSFGTSLLFLYYCCSVHVCYL